MVKNTTAKKITIIARSEVTTEISPDTKAYYLGNFFSQIKDLNILNLSDFFYKYTSDVKNILVNMDALFNEKLLSLAGTCSANLYLSKICDDFLKFYTLLKEIETNNNDVIIIVEDINDIQKLVIFFQENSHVVSNSSNKNIFENFINYTRKIKNYLVKFNFFIFELLYIKLLFFNHKIDFKKYNFISWLRDENHTDEELYKNNRYFGSIPYLMNKEGDTTFLGITINNVLNYKKILRNIKENKINVFILKNNCNPLDIVFSFFKSLEILKLLNRKYIINNINFSSIIRRSLIDDFWSFNFINSLIYYKCFIKLVSNLPKNAVIFYPFENQPWERALIFAAKESSKKIKLNAYQFFPISKNHLIYSFSEKNLKRGFVPDAIMTSDACSNQLFMNQGIPTIPLGSSRYQKEINNIESYFNFNKKVIMCSLFIDPQEALCLTNKAINLTKNLECSLLINYHALLSKDIIHQIKQSINGLSHVSLVKGSLINYLKDVSVVLYNSSSVCFDAALKGVPIIYVPCEGLPYMNRMNEDSKTSADKIDTIHLLKNLLTDIDSYKEYSTKVKNLANKLLYPLDKNQLEKIL